MKVYVDSSTKESCFVLLNGHSQQVFIEEYETKETNNSGEYKAVIRALTYLKENGMTDFIIFTDSKLVVQQTKGFNKCYSPTLAPLRDETRRLLGADHIMFKNLRIEWVPREQNLAGIILEHRS